MFLFFPLPAGVLMYMVIANIFQTLQTYILSREPLPENLQKLVEAEEKKEDGRAALPFEPRAKKEPEESKKASPKTSSKPSATAVKKETNPSSTTTNPKKGARKSSESAKKKG
jgi:YidC/Oxa1 family membrane protein insertase